MRAAAMAMALVLGLAGLATPAQAWSGRVTWTTWLRAGPGLQYQVLDEVNGGTPLEILDCAAGWCRAVSGRAIVYIQAELVAQPGPAAALTPGADCFDARNAGYKDGETLHICPK